MVESLDKKSTASLLKGESTSKMPFNFWGSHTYIHKYNVGLALIPSHTNTLEKWFPLWGELASYPGPFTRAVRAGREEYEARGERAHSLKLFCMYDKRFEIKKKNRMEEETEQQM